MEWVSDILYELLPFGCKLSHKVTLILEIIIDLKNDATNLGE